MDGRTHSRAPSSGAADDDEIPEVSIIGPPPGGGGGGTPAQWVGLEPSTRQLHPDPPPEAFITEGRTRHSSLKQTQHHQSHKERSSLARPKTPTSRRVTLNTTPDVMTPITNISPSEFVPDFLSNHSVVTQSRQRSPTNRSSRARKLTAAPNTNVTIKIEPPPPHQPASLNRNNVAQRSNPTKQPEKPAEVNTESQTNPVLFYPHPISPQYLMPPGPPFPHHNVTLPRPFIPPPVMHAQVPTQHFVRSPRFSLPLQSYPAGTTILAPRTTSEFPVHPSITPNQPFQPLYSGNAMVHPLWNPNMQQKQLMVPPNPFHPYQSHQYQGSPQGILLPPPVYQPPYHSNHTSQRYPVPPPPLHSLHPPPHTRSLLSDEDSYSHEHRIRLQASETSLRMPNQPWSIAAQNPSATFVMPEPDYHASSHRSKEPRDEPGVFPELNNEK